MKINLIEWTKIQLYVMFMCLAIGVVALSGMPLKFLSLWRIAQAPIATIGTVTKLDCGQHGRVEYSFVLDGSTIAGASQIVEGAPCKTLRLGQLVNVSYERGAPINNHAFSSTDNREGREAREFWLGVIFIGGFVTLGPLFLVFIARLFLRFRLRIGL